jgi:hypothetical protein
MLDAGYASFEARGGAPQPPPGQREATPAFTEELR